MPENSGNALHDNTFKMCNRVAHYGEAINWLYE